jgi:hypothetical protein
MPRRFPRRCGGKLLHAPLQRSFQWSYAPPPPTLTCPQGAFPVPLKLPQILGEDVAGIVLEAPEGSKVGVPYAGARQNWAPGPPGFEGAQGPRAPTQPLRCHRRRRGSRVQGAGTGRGVCSLNDWGAASGSPPHPPASRRGDLVSCLHLHPQPRTHPLE